MSAAIPITRLDRTASELRSLAGKCGDGAQVRRLLAIALVMEGRSRAEAAEQSGMDRQTLSDWVHRYNATGIDGLKSRHGPGAIPLLNEAQKAELRALVVAGPDPEKDKVIRWRCLDLQVEIARRFSVRVHESTVGKWLRQFRLTRLQARPCHPKTDLTAQEAFKKRARIGRPPVAVEADCAIVDPRGAAEKFLVDLTPQKNVVHGLLRTCEW
jgi:transposase